MSLPIDVLQELCLETRDQTKTLKKEVERLSKETDRLGNELSSARNDNELTRKGGEARQSSEYDEDSKRELQSELDAAYDINEELSKLNSELQMALDDVDRPGASGDDRTVQELQDSLREMQVHLNARDALNRELQVKNKILQDQLNAAAAGNWANLQPFLDENLSTRYRASRAKFLASQAELSEVKEELSKVNTELVRSEANLTELREENQALHKDLNTMRAASEIDAQKQETSQLAAKAKISPAERELLRLKDRQSLHVLHSGW